MNKEKHELPHLVRQGLKTFHEKSFYQAHEYFEDAWREEGGPRREFYRALIHISGGFFRLTEGKPQAARKFFVHAVKWLDALAQENHRFDIKLLMLTLEDMIREIDRQTPSHMLVDRFTPLILPDFNEVSP